MSRGCGLTSDCIFSSAWQRESREGQTDRGGSQRGSEAQTGSAPGRGMHRVRPSPTQTPQPCTKQRSTETALTEE